MACVAVPCVCAQPPQAAVCPNARKQGTLRPRASSEPELHTGCICMGGGGEGGGGGASSPRVVRSRCTEVRPARCPQQRTLCEHDTSVCRVCERLYIITSKGGRAQLPRAPPAGPSRDMNHTQSHTPGRSPGGKGLRRLTPIALQQLYQCWHKQWIRARIDLLAPRCVVAWSLWPVALDRARVEPLTTRPASRMRCHRAWRCPCPPLRPRRRRGAAPPS